MGANTHGVLVLPVQAKTLGKARYLRVDTECEGEFVITLPLTTFDGLKMTALRPSTPSNMLSGGLRAH